MSPRTLNRELLKSINLEEISDLSSISSFTSDDFSDIVIGARAHQVEFDVASIPPGNENPIEDSDSSSELEDDEQVRQLLFFYKLAVQVSVTCSVSCS